MNASEKITEYISKHDDWKGELLSQIREMVLQTSSGITEEWKWNSPVWSENGLVCSAGAFKNHVKLNFFEGASLEDPDKLFNGGLDSKKMRSIDFRKGDEIAPKALTTLLEKAVAYNGQNKTD